MQIRPSDTLEVLTEDGHAISQGDVQVTQVCENGRLTLSLLADTTPVSFIRMRWNFAEHEAFSPDTLVLGDAWERGYGDFAWKGIDPDRPLPWLFAAASGSDRESFHAGHLICCFGVETRPNAMCMFQTDTHGVTLWADVRCGGEGVVLSGRKLTVCHVRFEEYSDTSAYLALRRFASLLCPDPLTPPEPVYGSNNWYYAYGKSSETEILQDTALLAELTQGLSNRPYMVIDDGWQINATDGPWDRGNAHFPDMAGLAQKMKAQDVLPGIWIRYLSDLNRQMPEVQADWRLMRCKDSLDPSHSAVLEKVRRDTERLTKEWGFRLIKHDFSTFDIFGKWGNQMKAFPAEGGWTFHDRSRTSAEIIQAFYRTILESAAPGTLILGCNTIGHLSAGLVHLSRTGDDTSGHSFDKTRRMGVNTLAFRLYQQGTFFGADADCVGITGEIPWEKNRLWLDLLAASGTPLFVSLKPDQATEPVKADLRAAYTRASRTQPPLTPMDWMENTMPEKYTQEYDTYEYPWLEDGVTDLPGT
ncbi:MAG: alpha-galactosidase [Clostridia bacterium]|nr:alpha-galactosidase [Clostridia bacterium]MBR1686789.1 alpha-galactosidase [Clostridia bacterium]